ncbi:MAG: acyl carrier protein [Deltaproteobacteria bacterium]|nr:acyl carrier protein [Deltaproteobacteria bacterium]
MERPNEALRRYLKELILRSCDITELSPDDLRDEDPLFGTEGPLELTSLDAVEIAMAVEHEFKVKIENMSSAREYFRCVASLADHVTRRCDPALLARVLSTSA